MFPTKCPQPSVKHVFVISNAEISLFITEPFLITLYWKFIKFLLWTYRKRNLRFIVLHSLRKILKSYILINFRSVGAVLCI